MALPIPNDIVTLFDSYGRQARLFPALLTIFTPLLTVLAWFPWLVLSSLTATLLTIATSCGILYALASWARTKGRRIEPKLVKSWGGWPTTILLRHNSDLDTYTRSRYVNFLKNSLPDLVFMTAEEEKERPKQADEIYNSAVKWLKEYARDNLNIMVLRENAQYGFRRNLLGLKIIGIILCTTAFLLSLSAVAFTNPQYTKMFLHYNMDEHIVALTGIGPAVLSATFLNIVAILFWLGLVTQKWVKEAGFQYAIALLATCESIKKD